MTNAQKAEMMREQVRAKEALIQAKEDREKKDRTNPETK